MTTGSPAGARSRRSAAPWHQVGAAELTCAGPTSVQHETTQLIRRIVVLSASAIVAVVALAWLLGWRGPGDVLPARPGADRQATAPPAGATGAPAQPPPTVGVVEVSPRQVPLPVAYAGRIGAPRDVEIRPRVGGLLLSREFDEGAGVKDGQVLFRIDPATFRVALARAEAQLAQARAAVRQAEDNYARVSELRQRNVASEQQLEQATGTRDQARAAVDLAQAEVEAARLNLDYTTIVSPVAGVTALTSPAVGSLIQPQQTLLTTITPLDPAYVNFSFTDQEAQDFRELNEHRAKPISEKDLTVELRFGDRSRYDKPGRIDTAAQRVDQQTGTIQARAVFPNPDGVLLPGQFVRVVIRGVTLPDALVVPERAVSQGPQGASVYVVTAANVAEARPVRLGQEVRDGFVVTSGLQPGERVVVDGVVRVKPGQLVRAVPAKPSPEGGAAAAQSSEGAPATTGSAGVGSPDGSTGGAKRSGARP
ncbi:efflux transporter periplasmic adaptor subunit [Rhodoplanes roseus]|uniref:Efflux transporter periplasmic adaptor subunit n=1 Tax=Rhodoplanes roseus TaxID=29409 RepID=A0A327L550_9BRAD|nr:efflux transporter periplasmic adaptor subunit [Rhodoplanes roseus]